MVLHVRDGMECTYPSIIVFPSILTYCLTAVKFHLKGQMKIGFGQLKILARYSVN